MSGYDMTPWKVRICAKTVEECGSHDLMIADLPPAPEPGRLPDGADHIHIVQKWSADQRDARGDLKWRGLLLTTTRCEHGRTQGDTCVSCPLGYAPDRSGTRVGTTYGAQAVVIPPRESQNDPKAWVQD